MVICASLCVTSEIGSLPFSSATYMSRNLVDLLLNQRVETEKRASTLILHHLPPASTAPPRKMIRNWSLIIQEKMVPTINRKNLIFQLHFD